MSIISEDKIYQSVNKYIGNFEQLSNQDYKFSKNKPIISKELYESLESLRKDKEVSND